MKGRKSSRRHCSERGILLMEHAVSLPIFALLLTFLAFVLLWSWRSYQNEIADAELRHRRRAHCGVGAAV